VARAAISMGQVKADGKPDVDAWLEQVTKQQHVDIDIYLADAVWPSVALKKLVGDNLPITEEDLKKGYEANYGPRAKCRAIILSNQRKAQEVWEKARDNPTLEHFAVLAKQYSSDSSSGSLGGQIPPIQRHGGQPLLEAEAFALKPNELSGVVQVGENFIILFCEGYSKPIEIDMDEARKYIEEDLREKKMRIAMHKEYNHLAEVCTIDNYLAGTMKSPRAEKAKREGKDAALDLPPSMSNMPATPGRGKSVR
jgi:parvulin-like peptidyl-prolyl isomerase